MSFVLRNALTWQDGTLVKRDVAVARGRVVVSATAAEEVDLAGHVLLPGLVNGHDHLGFSIFPALGRPPYHNAYEWAADVDKGAGDARVPQLLAVPLADRLFLGGLRNLLAGVTAVAHHDAYHRSLGRTDFPVRVLADYRFAHSPGLTPRLRSTYRWGGPWMVHAAEGVDERSRGEIDVLDAAGVLRPNTVLVHGVGLRPEDGARIAAARAGVVWCPESNRRLYGATAPVVALAAAGVRLALGSDAPVSGVRDALSNLRAAWDERVFEERELLELATRRTAELLRLPLGGFEPGAPADFLAVDSIASLLSGARPAVRLVTVAGRRCYGEAPLMPAGSVVGSVDGAIRALEPQIARRFARILRAHPAVRNASWMAGLKFEYDGGGRHPRRDP